MIDNYQLVYNQLSKKLAGIDLSETVRVLGGYPEGNNLWIKFIETPYIISHQGIWDTDKKEPDVSIRIILCHYLLQAGRGKLRGEWVSYRDYKDAAFFISNFQVNVEECIARFFSGRADALKNAAARLDGRPYKDPQYDEVCYYIQALPKIPVLLVFYDRDDEFPASCKLLFDRSASIWLDMECLAVLGRIIADRLIAKNNPV